MEVAGNSGIKIPFAEGRIIVLPSRSSLLFSMEFAVDKVSCQMLHLAAMVKIVSPFFALYE